METLVTALKRTTNIRAGVNLLAISDFLISERCYGHCTERCSRDPLQRPRHGAAQCCLGADVPSCPKASTNIDVGSAQRTSALPRTICVQSIVARQTANMNVNSNMHSLLP